MAEVRLGPWRLTDAGDVAVMIDDEHLRPWSTMAADLDAWIQREVAEHRGPSRAICLPDDDRALGRVALRLPQFASEAVRGSRPVSTRTELIIIRTAAQARPRPRAPGTSQ
jgi:hypothetical protein